MSYERPPWNSYPPARTQATIEVLRYTVFWRFFCEGRGTPQPNFVGNFCFAEMSIIFFLALGHGSWASVIGFALSVFFSCFFFLGGGLRYRVRLSTQDANEIGIFCELGPY